MELQKFFVRMGLTLVALYIVGSMISASFDISHWSTLTRWILSLGFLSVFSTVSIMEYYDQKDKEKAERNSKK